MESVYLGHVRSFDHSQLAALPAYQALRQALSDLANQAGLDLGDLLAAVRDMTVTAPYGDCCTSCGRGNISWPHSGVRHDGWLTGYYRCPAGHQWKCGYAIAVPAYSG